MNSVDDSYSVSKVGLRNYPICGKILEEFSFPPPKFIKPGLWKWSLILGKLARALMFARGKADHL